MLTFLWKSLKVHYFRPLTATFIFFLQRPELLWVIVEVIVEVYCGILLCIHGNGRGQPNFMRKFYAKDWLLKFVLYPIFVWLDFIQAVVLFFRTNGEARSTRTGLFDLYFVMFSFFLKIFLSAAIELGRCVWLVFFFCTKIKIGQFQVVFF